MTAEQLTTVSTPACVVSEPTTTNTNTAQYAASSSSSAKYPKKRVAILFGYNGEKYHGLQFSKDVPTVEQELVNALAKVGLVLESNSTDPFKMSMNRCARTDKGVHAVRQVVSLKIMFPPNLKVNDMPAFINTALPEHVRVWSVVKTVGSFDSKTQCTSRRYEYILPTYTLGSPHPLSMFHPQNAKFVEETGTRANPLKFPIIEEIGKMGKNKEELVAYRATPNQLSKLRSIVEAYKGRHNFHNFTIGKSFKEAYCHRYILEASMSEPFYVDGMEWVRVLFHGQSFMLHQIRKMIGKDGERERDCYYYIQ